MKKTALAFSFLFALTGCKGVSAWLNSGTSQNAPTLSSPLPIFELENIAGGVTKTADLKGKVLVVDFWATWCEPCLSEIPKFNKMTDEYKGRDVQVVGITVESPHDDIKPKVKEIGMKYTVLVGNDATEEGFGGLVGFPTTFVVTKEGKIYHKYMGALPDKDARIRKDIEKLLAEANASD